MAARRRTASAFRPGTKANQRSHVLLYVAFSKFFQETDFPAAVGHLLRFAEFVLRSCRAHRSATNALASVRTFHLQCGFDVQAFADFRLVLWRSDAVQAYFPAKQARLRAARVLAQHLS